MKDSYTIVQMVNPARKRFSLQSNSLLLLIFSFFFASSLWAADKDSYETKTIHLEYKGPGLGHRLNIANRLDFPAEEKSSWKFCVITIIGNWEKDITHKPSQEFLINVNGVEKFSKQLKGTTHISFKLPYNTKEVKVGGYMEGCNMATHISGSITVTCFREAPGVFYATQIIYDTDKAIRGKDEQITADEKNIYNDSPRDANESIELSYAESKSLSWNKSSSHSENIGISVGWKANSTTGGLEAMASFNEKFETSYSQGSVEQKSAIKTYKTSVIVPPSAHHRIFLVQNKVTYTMPYTLIGYTLEYDEKNNIITQKPDKHSGECIFSNIDSHSVYHSDLSTNAEPKLLKTF